MSIDATSESLIKMIEKNYYHDHNDHLDGLSFHSVTTNQFNQNPSDQVTLFLYRIDVDRTKRHKEIYQVDLSAKPQKALALELHYLLTVWADKSDRQQSTLAYCMYLLDKFSILSGDLLQNINATHEWYEGAEIKIQLESITNEDMLRLWDAVEPSYQLSVSYLVRTVLLQAVEYDQASIVENKTDIWVSGVSQ